MMLYNIHGSGLAEALAGFLIAFFSLICSQHVMAQLDYQQLANMAKPSEGIISVKDAKVYLTAPDMFIRSRDLCSKSLPVRFYMKEGVSDLSSFLTTIAVTINGDDWEEVPHNLPQSFNPHCDMDVDLSRWMKPLDSFQWLVVRVQITDPNKKVFEHKSVIGVFGEQCDLNVAVYDVGGTVQGKQKFTNKRKKSERDAFQPVVKSMNANAQKKVAVCFLTSFPKEEVVTLRRWFIDRGLPCGPIFMPSSSEDDQEDDSFHGQRKLETLGQLSASGIHFVEAWGNGVVKDILPFMKHGVPVVNHISWLFSAASSTELLDRVVIDQPYHQHERQTVFSSVEGRTYPAALSVYGHNTEAHRGDSLSAFRKDLSRMSQEYSQWYTGWVSNNQTLCEKLKREQDEGVQRQLEEYQRADPEKVTTPR